jgi:hypothetical protein
MLKLQVYMSTAYRSPVLKGDDSRSERLSRDEGLVNDRRMH